MLKAAPQARIAATPNVDMVQHLTKIMDSRWRRRNDSC